MVSQIIKIIFPVKNPPKQTRNQKNISISLKTRPMALKVSEIESMKNRKVMKLKIAEMEFPIVQKI